MKKIITTAAVFFATILNVNAQSYETPDNEISLSVGLPTHPFLGVAFGDAFSSIITDDNGSESSYGAYSLTYLHNCSKHIAVGAAATFEHTSKDTKKGPSISDNFLAVMPTARAYWFRNKSFGMYSRLAAGVAFNFYDDLKYNSNNTDTEKESKTDMLFAFQLSPVSFEFGSNKVSGFLELGYGYQGIFNAGIRLGF